jgi:putative Holliday junction resolvase
VDGTTDKVYIGIDYGGRRIGLARSDPSGTIATALTTLEVSSVKDAVAQLGRIVQKHRPAGIVVGYPLSMSGRKGPKCREVDDFIKRLQKVFSGPIHKIDERLTSAEARRVVHAHGKKVGEDKGRIDRLAAVLILQRFLDTIPLSTESEKDESE